MPASLFLKRMAQGIFGDYFVRTKNTACMSFRDDIWCFQNVRIKWFLYVRTKQRTKQACNQPCKSLCKINSQEVRMIYAVATIKGGQGKTTLATALATAPAWERRRVYVELDPQGDGALVLGMQKHERLASWRQAFSAAIAGRGELSAALGMLPDGSTGYFATDDGVYGISDAMALRRLLKPFRACTVVIDLPPQETSVSLMGMCAADRILIPATLDELGLAGMARTARFFRTAVQPQMPDVSIAGVVPVRVKTAAREQTRQLESSMAKLKQLADALGIPILPGIRERQAVRSAQDQHASIWDYPAAVDVRADMAALIDVLRREEDEEG